MADERDEVRSRVDIVDLVSREGIRLKKVGKSYTGLCPFHADKRPSFMVSPETGRYKCWSCGESGDAFTWVMKRQNVDFIEALRTLAKEVGVTLSQTGQAPTNRHLHETAMAEAQAFFREQFARSSTAQDYCRNRGIDQDALDQWEIGYAPDVGEALAVHLKKKGLPLAECRSLFLVEEDGHGGYYDKFRGRLMFPIRDEKGSLVAFGGRVLGDKLPKYINSSDTPIYRKSRVLYGMNRARDFLMKSRHAVLVEGYLDVIACHRAGVSGALASLGTALSEEHAKLLKRWCDEVTILYDSDDAGQKAAARAVEMLRAEGVRVTVALMPAGDDPDTLLRSQGPDAVKRAVEGGLSPVDYRIRAIEKKHTPDREEFWEEVVMALAESPNELELARHLDRLSPLYPGIRDHAKAEKAIRQMVVRARKKSKSSNEPERRGAAVFEHRTMRGKLNSAEIVVLMAFLTKEFRNQGWMFARTTALFETGAGIELSKAIGAAFPSGAPTGPPSEWLHRLPSEEMQQLLSDILLDLRAEHLSEQYVADAVTRLKDRMEARRLEEMKRSGADKSEIFRRLKERKPDSRAKPASDDDLF